MFDIQLYDNNIPYIVNVSDERLLCDTPEELVRLVNARYDLSHSFNEQVLVAACINNVILDFYRLSVGGRDYSIVDTRALFTALLLRGASNFIIVHNHPSGSCSRSDNNMCMKLQEAARLMDMQLLDFIIIGRSNDYYSFKEQGKIP